jgi:hypothetical protein
MASLFDEADQVADALWPRSLDGDCQVAFQQLRKSHLPDIRPEFARDAFELWKLHYASKRVMEKAKQIGRMQALLRERDKLSDQRASLPPHRRAAVEERIAAIAREIADVYAQRRRPPLGSWGL